MGCKFFSALATTMIVFSLASGSFTAGQATSGSQGKVTKPGYETPRYGGTLKIIQTTGPKTPFGWPPESVGESSIPAKPAVEALLRARADGTYEPHLAEAFKVAPDKSSITFHLRKGIKFHDGTAFTADAVKFNLEAQRQEKRPGTEDWGSIEVIDDFTVRVNLKRYRNILFRYFSGTGGSIVSPSAFKNRGLEFVRWNPVGTGPFEFVSFERDVGVKYKKFGGYWVKGQPYLDGIEYLFISDPMTQRAVMEANEADVLLAKNMKIAAELRDMGFEAFPAATGTVVLIPDSANPSSPLSDKRVREAIEYAINKEAIVKAKGFGFLEAQYQLPLRGTIGYIKNFKGRTHNIEKARSLLRDAGYEKGLKLKIIPYVGIDRDIVVILQDQLKKINVDLEIELVDLGKFTDYRRKGWQNGFLIMPQVMGNFLWSIEFYYGPDAKDFPVLKKPSALAGALSEAISTLTPQVERIQKITRLIFEDITVIPLYTQAEVYICRKNVRDANFMKFESFTDWTPEKVWLMK